MTCIGWWWLILEIPLVKIFFFLFEIFVSTSNVLNLKIDFVSVRWALGLVPHFTTLSFVPPGLRHHNLFCCVEVYCMVNPHFCKLVFLLSSIQVVNHKCELCLLIYFGCFLAASIVRAEGIATTVWNSSNLWVHIIWDCNVMFWEVANCKFEFLLAFGFCSEINTFIGQLRILLV